MPRLLFTCLLSCLLLCGTVVAQVSAEFAPDPAAEAEQQPEQQNDSADGSAAAANSDIQAFEALVGWLKDEPEPATPLRLRLRDGVLKAVLDPEMRWEVVALSPGSDAVPLAAVLELPDGSAGWLLYSVEAALGPARGEVLSGKTYWPLLLSDNRLPLTKLKLVASRPATGTPFAKAVDIVRLGEDGSVLRSLASGVVNPEGVAGAGPNWFELQPEVQAETWAVEVHDQLGDTAGDSMLQLSKLDVYAAEVFLRVALPANAELRLRVYPADHPSAPVQAAEPDAAAVALAAQPAPELYGELRQLTEFVPPPPPSSGQRGRTGRMLELPGLPALPSMPGWLPALLLGLVGLGLVALGMRLMQGTTPD